MTSTETFTLDPTKIIPGTCFICGEDCGSEFVGHAKCCITYYDFKEAYLRNTPLFRNIWDDFRRVQAEPAGDCQT